MITTPESPTPAPPRVGCFNRLVAAACNLYLLFMVAFFVLRFVVGKEPWWIALLNAFAIHTFVFLLVLVPLAIAARLWRHLARLGFLAFWAVFWFGPYFQPEPTIKPGDGALLRVVTFDAQGDPIDEAEVWLRETGADLILLQDCAESCAQDTVPALLDRYPIQIDQGNRRFLLSRYPVTEETVFSDAQARAIIEIDGQQIALYHVHLDAPERQPLRWRIDGGELLNYLLNYDETRRNRQIDLLLAALQTETLPYIVAGNFNLSQHSLIYGSLAVTMTDTFRVTNNGLGATWPAHWPLLRLDYVWVSDGFRAIRTETGPNLESDHLPVVAEVELLAAAPGTPSPESTETP